MNIYWITAEAVPFAKTGGLADVSGALPDALADRGHNVSVFMPYWKQQMGGKNIRFTGRFDMLPIPFGPGNTEFATVHFLKVKKGLTFYFLEFNRFFDRPRLYDWNGKEYDDNADRFIFFCRAAMEFAIKMKMKPDILHANDWHAALCCVYRRSWLYDGTRTFRNCRTVLTIHNIGYQGVFWKEKLNCTGLGWEFFNYTCLEYHDCLNFLKGGIMTADMVNAVSPTYAREILSPAYGFTLDDALRNCDARGRLRGILNGIDIKEWDPEHDKHLAHKFSADDLSGKAQCKADLQRLFGLPVRPDAPLFCTISRLASQKGLDVFASGLEHLLYHKDYQFIVIGSGDEYLQNWFNYLHWKYPQKFGVYIGYAPDMVSHLAEAGSDFFVMPSRYEPCGLNQMYSMRYGTLPIVRNTGGLADTVVNYVDGNAEKASGFSFYDLTPEALDNTIMWAAGVREREPEAFRRMIRNAMTTDFSWNRTAGNYERMYQDAHE